MSDLTDLQAPCPMTAPIDPKTQEGAVLSERTVSVKASAIRAGDLLLTNVGRLEVVRVKRTAQGSVWCLLRLDDAKTMIWTGAPESVQDVIRGEVER